MFDSVQTFERWDAPVCWTDETSRLFLHRTAFTLQAAVSRSVIILMSGPLAYKPSLRVGKEIGHLYGHTIFRLV